MGRLARVVRAAAPRTGTVSPSSASFTPFIIVLVFIFVAPPSAATGGVVLHYFQMARRVG
jgi:hypothetical protein